MHVVDVCHGKVGGGVRGDVALLTGCLNELLGLTGVSCQPAHIPAHDREAVSLSSVGLHVAGLLPRFVIVRSDEISTMTS